MTCRQENTGEKVCVWCKIVDCGWWNMITRAKWTNEKENKTEQQIRTNAIQKGSKKNKQYSLTIKHVVLSIYGQQTWHKHNQCLLYTFYWS